MAIPPALQVLVQEWGSPTGEWHSTSSHSTPPHGEPLSATHCSHTNTHTQL